MDKYFVLLKAKSIIETFDSLGLIYHGTFKSKIRHLTILSISTCLIIKGLLFKFSSNSLLKLIFGHYEESLGAIASVVWVTIALSVIEIMSFRFWIIYEYIHTRIECPKESFFSLFSELPEESLKLILKISKSNYMLLSFILNILFSIMIFVQMIRTTDKLELFSLTIWLILYVYYLRYLGSDLSTIYIAGFGAYKAIDVKCDSLMSTIIDHGKILKPIDQIDEIFKKFMSGQANIQSRKELEFLCELSHQYIVLINSIKRFRRFASNLILASQLLVIPAFSSTIYYLSLEERDLFDVILKQVAISASFLFFSRSYIITAVFSNINSESKKVHHLLSIFIVRKSLSPNLKKKLLELMESISSSRNCMAIPQYGEKFVKQIDILFNLLNTIQFILLCFDFKKFID